MTRGESFIKNAKCTHGHRLAISNSAWCDLNKNCTVLNMHDMCHNPKYNCQKQITFSPRQFQLEGGLRKRKLQKTFKRTQIAWNNFLQPALNIASPYIGMVVSARTKTSQTGKATSDILKSISGGKILSPTDMHGHGLRLKEM